MDVVYQENRLCLIILDHIYVAILKLSDFMSFTGWRNNVVVVKKIGCV